MKHKIDFGFKGKFLLKRSNDLQFFLLNYYKKDIREIKKIAKKENNFTMLSPQEAFMIQELSRAQQFVKGDYAEVGCYKGFSAEIIARNKGLKHLYLFENFDGLEELKESDRVLFKENMFSSDFNIFKERFREYKNVHIHKGFFPKQTGKFIKDKTFSFVHLDMDLYDGTLKALEFFYPRLSNGGVIISHDYPSAKGIKEAVDIFCNRHAVTHYELPTRQVMIIK